MRKFNHYVLTAKLSKLDNVLALLVNHPDVIEMPNFVMDYEDTAGWAPPKKQQKEHVPSGFVAKRRQDFLSMFEEKIPYAEARDLWIEKLGNRASWNNDLHVLINLGVLEKDNFDVIHKRKEYHPPECNPAHETGPRPPRRRTSYGATAKLRELVDAGVLKNFSFQTLYHHDTFSSFPRRSVRGAVYALQNTGQISKSDGNGLYVVIKRQLLELVRNT
jgi:hypothetical protein